MSFLEKKKKKATTDENVMAGTENVGTSDADFDNMGAESMPDEGGFPTDSDFDESTDWSISEREGAAETNTKKSRPVAMIVGTLLAVVAAVGLFYVMLNTWSQSTIAIANQSKNIMTTHEVLIASNELNQYTEMTLEEILANTKTISVHADAVPEGAITERSKLLGLSTTHKIAKGGILTEDDFEKFDNVVQEGMVEITVPISGLLNTVAGELKPGDEVILAYNAEAGLTEFYTTTIYKMFDGSGVEMQDAKTVSVMSFLIPREDATLFYQAQNFGQIIALKPF